MKRETKKTGRTKRTFISFLCAGVMAIGLLAGLTGFAAEDTQEEKGLAEESGSEIVLLSDAQDSDEETGTLTVEEVAEKVMPSVVTITNTSVVDVQSMYGFGYGFGMGNDDGGFSYDAVSAGSGIIIGESEDELLILTNYHVVEDADELTVGFIDDEAYEAVVKGTDEAIDVAVVAVPLDDISEDTMSQIAVAEIGNSDDLMLGQQVVAIGNALGYGQSVTTGIVSALRRTVELDTYTAEMIQTDAAINGGNSGGPLLDMNGRVVGINSAKATATGVEGMGYAIPISDVTDIVEQLMNAKTRTEEVDEDQSAYIGIVGKEVSEEMSEYGIPEGIYITEVTEGSPAEEAGLKTGYIITRFDSSSVHSMSDLKSRLAFYEAGETVPVTVSYQSDGEYVEETIDLTLGLLSDYQSVES